LNTSKPTIDYPLLYVFLFFLFYRLYKRHLSEDQQNTLIEIFGNRKRSNCCYGVSRISCGCTYLIEPSPWLSFYGLACKNM